MNTYLQAGAVKPPNQPVFFIASVYVLKKDVANLSLGAYFGCSPRGSGLCFEGRAHAHEQKEASALASTLACSAPASHTAGLSCAKQQAVSRRQL